MKIYGKISHLDEFSKWEKLIWEFIMGNCTILVIELFHLKMGKISQKNIFLTFPVFLCRKMGKIFVPKSGKIFGTKLENIRAVLETFEELNIDYHAPSSLCNLYSWFVITAWGLLPKTMELQFVRQVNLWTNPRHSILSFLRPVNLSLESGFSNELLLSIFSCFTSSS